MPETRWNLAWADRPAEEARNLNPAFCAELIARTVGEFHKNRQTPLSMAVAFLVLPLTLHKPTRDTLPGRANAAFATWVAENGPLLAELPGRVNRLRPISREALLFAIRYRLLAIHDGGLVPGSDPVRLTFRPRPSTDDVSETRAAAGLLGRWFAGQATEGSILQGLGVAP
jgi:hypothetical protein